MKISSAMLPHSGRYSEGPRCSEAPYSFLGPFQNGPPAQVASTTMDSLDLYRLDHSHPETLHDDSWEAADLAKFSFQRSNRPHYFTVV